ncbi:MAG: HEPN domain-containing protein [Candidatus Brocadiales bacterium]
MDGKDFLKVATSLVEGTEEAEYRSAVSRAYYAAFLFARQLLVEWGFQVKHAYGGHDELYKRFHNCGQTEIVEAASDLKDLYSRRLDADYLRKNNKINIGQQKTAKLYVLFAEKIIAQLETCREYPIKKKVIEGIRLYDAKIKGYPK